MSNKFVLSHDLRRLFFIDCSSVGFIKRYKLSQIGLKYFGKTLLKNEIEDASGGYRHSFQKHAPSCN